MNAYVLFIMFSSDSGGISLSNSFKLEINLPFGNQRVICYSQQEYPIRFKFFWGCPIQSFGFCNFKDFDFKGSNVIVDGIFIVSLL